MPRLRSASAALQAHAGLREPLRLPPQQGLWPGPLELIVFILVGAIEIAVAFVGACIVLFVFRMIFRGRGMVRT
jgi:hypothetical protein